MKSYVETERKINKICFRLFFLHTKTHTHRGIHSHISCFPLFQLFFVYSSHEVKTITKPHPYINYLSTKRNDDQLMNWLKYFFLRQSFRFVRLFYFTLDVLINRPEKKSLFFVSIQFVGYCSMIQIFCYHSMGTKIVFFLKQITIFFLQVNRNWFEMKFKERNISIKTWAFTMERHSINDIWLRDRCNYFQCNRVFL